MVSPRWLVQGSQSRLLLILFFVVDIRHFSFPLFSKGVDTYRFEYGVFLLNKDIEMVCLFCAGTYIR